MEQFVRLVVAGGVALVAGLWIVEFSAAWSSPWLAGMAVAILGVVVLLAGTVSKLEF